MRREILIVAASLVALGLAVWLIASRSPSDPTPNAPVRTRAERARTLSRDQASERLRTLQTESAARMPDDVRGVFIGLRREELLALRSGAQPARGAPEGHVLYQEVLGNGAVVAYLVSTRLDRVAQVQFLSRLTEVSRVASHYRALRERYGEPSGLFDCPQSGDTAPTRRILWTGREVTVMEAILAHPSGVSLTLAVAGNGEVASAMRSNGCTPVTQRTLDDWPIATELRGERVVVPRP